MAALVEKIIEKAIMYLGKEDNKQRIQLFILDPLLNHIIERLFPYFILIAILFFVLVILIFILFALIMWDIFRKRIIT